MASYGFVIVATESCPTTECFAGFAADMLATVKACRDDPSLHPALATADFSRVGVFGHSMGAMAALAAAGPYKGADPSAYNIKAVVSQHPCSDPTVPRLGADVTVPVMFTAGSADTLCEDGCAWSMRDKATKAPSRVMFDLKGTTHFEPCNAGGGKAGGGGLEDTAVALFLSCWVRGDHCDKVYGASGRAICGQIPPTASLYSCTVNGTK